MLRKYAVTTEIWDAHERWDSWQNLLMSVSPYECEYSNPVTSKHFSASMQGWACLDSHYTLNQTQYAGNEAQRSKRHVEDGYHKYLLILILSGQGLMQRHQQQVIMKPGFIYVVDLAQPMQTKVCDSLSMLSVHIPRSELEEVVKGVGDRAIHSFSCESGQGWLLKNYLQMLPYTLNTIEHGSGEIFTPIKGLLRPLFSKQDREGDNNQRVKQAVLVDQCRQYMQEHCHMDNFDMDRLSKLIQLSPSYIHRIFKLEGCKFSYELKRLRVQRAKQKLILQGRRANIAHIGYDCGFKSSSQFSKAFKEVTGTSPKQFSEEYASRILPI